MLEENAQFSELFQILGTRPEAEAFEILHRIRKSQDPLVVLKSVREADLLLDTVHSAASADRQLQDLETAGPKSVIVHIHGPR